MEGKQSEHLKEIDDSESIANVEPVIIPRDQHPVSRKNMTEEVLKVLYRLKNKGHVAYLCGGGVRDLLLGKKPKDFDVATDARPGRLKQIFHNAWLVGKRFRLAHMVFKGGRVIEVSTFRRLAEVPERAGEDTLMIHRDNTFGTEVEDAFRRDFTINALYYNVADYSIIDYVEGLKDIQRRMIRSVGDPFIRFQEDPVRICRGIRFAVHLDFTFEENTWRAMLEHGPKVAHCPSSRVQEELLRFMRGGALTKGFRLLHETGVLKAVLPEIEVYASDPGRGELFWSILEKADELRPADEPYSDGALWAFLFMLPVFDALDEAGPQCDAYETGFGCLMGPGTRMSIPKATRRTAVQLLTDAHLMASAPPDAKQGKKAARMFAHTGFKEALTVLDAYVDDREADRALVEAWRRQYERWENRREGEEVRKPRRRKRKANRKTFDNVPKAE